MLVDPFPVTTFMYHIGMTVLSIALYSAAILFITYVAACIMDGATKKARSTFTWFIFLATLTVGVLTYPKVFTIIWF